MLRHIAFGLLGLLIPVSLVAEDSPAFRWQKTITFDAESKSILNTVPLDSDVYAQTREGFPDLRLRDRDGQPVPFLIRQQIKQREETSRVSWAASNSELKPTDDGLEIKVALQEDDPLPIGLAIITPLKSFEQRVDVFGTEPGQPEQQLVKDALIFDYSQFMDVRRSDIRLPESKCRQFRVLLKALTANQESELLQLSRSLTDGGKTESLREERTSIQRRAFRIERIDFWRETKRLAEKSKVERDYPVAKFEPKEDTEKQLTTLTITTHREPLTGFEIATTDSNFRRSLQVQIPVEKGARTEWHEIASGSISKFAIGDFSESKLKVRFPEQRHATYRLVIQHGDSRPLQIESINGIGNVYETVSLHGDKSANALTYGSELAKSPQFDLAAIQLALERASEMTTGTLGPQTEATPEDKMPLNLRGLVNNPVLLGGVVCVLVAVLAACLVKAGKRISQLPDDSNDDGAS